MRNDRLSLTSKAVISWYDFLKGLTVCGQCPFTDFSIIVLRGAVKLSVARGKLIVAVQTLFFICSLRYGYGIWQATIYAIYSIYDWKYTVYCALNGCNILAITHNPEAAGSSSVAVTMFNRWFREKSAVFMLFEWFEGMRIGALAPTVPRRG